MKLKKRKYDEDALPKALGGSKKKVKEKSTIKKKILIWVLIAIVLFIAWLVIGMVRWTNLATDMLANENSIVKDTDGNNIGTIGEEKRKLKVSYKDIPEKLRNAYIAIEDERFYKHHGVDLKRTASATLSYIIHFGSSSFGGSSITQQLVKNLTGDSSDSVIRKIKEWGKAWSLEFALSKEEILEGYLNAIYVGPNLYGVQTGAKYYFNKSIGELSLAECAFLAGINNAPNSYNPFDEKDNNEKIKKRTKTVLTKMKELKYIDEESCNKALSQVDEGLNFKKGEVKKGDAVYSYHTDALIPEITEDISKKYNISKTFAENYVNMAGLTIYSTQNSKIQAQVNSEFEKKKYQVESKNGNDPSEAAMVIIDHKNGNVVACARTDLVKKQNHEVSTVQHKVQDRQVLLQNH